MIPYFSVIILGLLVFVAGIVYGHLLHREERRDYVRQLRVAADMLESLMENLPAWSAQRRRPMDFVLRWRR